MKLLLIPLVALSLSGCGMIPTLLGGMAQAPAPQQIADQTTADEIGGIGIETLYAASARAGALAFRAGIVTPSTNPAVQSDGFCALVRARAFEPTDRGSEIMALECKLRAARDAGRAAYDAGNSQSYTAAYAQAESFARELLALIRGD